jgi:hypothetical protein
VTSTKSLPPASYIGRRAVSWNRESPKALALATPGAGVGPRPGPEWTRAIAPYEAMTVLADEHVLLTPGFERLRVS